MRDTRQWVGQKETIKISDTVDWWLFWESIGAGKGCKCR